MDEEDVDYLLVAVLLRRRRRRRDVEKRKKRFWVREIYQKRSTHGLFHSLVQELRLADREYYFKLDALSYILTHK